MGNRGSLHNDSCEIVRQFDGRRWIACVLEFKGRRRVLMAPGRYTELFFLDEAVAFAAGHRPCAECRRERFIAFKDAWKRRREVDLRQPVRAPEIDAELHRTRIDNRRRKVTYAASLNLLQNGCFVEIDESAYLVWNEALLLWTPGGYAKKQRRPDGLTVTVLTPQPIVQCFGQGFEPDTHDSSHAL